MKKILLAGVITVLALPVIAADTTTTISTSPQSTSTTTTTTTVQEQQKMEAEEAPAAATEPAVSEPARVPTETPAAVDTLPRTGTGTLNQQRMEDATSDDDETGEYVPKIDDVDDSEDYE